MEGVGKLLARRAVRGEAQDLAFVGGDVGEAALAYRRPPPPSVPKGRAALARRQHHGHTRQAGLEEGRRRTERKSLDVEVGRPMEAERGRSGGRGPAACRRSPAPRHPSGRSEGPPLPE